MRKNSLAASLTVLALLVLSTGIYVVPAKALTSGNSCTEQSNPYSVTAANWGTAGSPQSVYPGDEDVPLTVTMLFYGPCTSAQSSFVLDFVQGATVLPFTASNGGSQTPENVQLDIATGTLVTQTFYLDIDQSATTGVSYNIPLAIQYSNGTASYVTTELTSAQIQLFGPVQLNFNANASHLVPGADNNVTITISNSGSSGSGPVSTTVTAPSGVTLLNQLATAGALAPGASTTQLLQVYVSSSLSGSAFVLTFSAKYLDPYNNLQTYGQTIGFTVPGSSGAQSSSSFMVDGASWGTASSGTEVLPGTQDAALVVSLQYLSATPVTSLEGSLILPAGMTNLNGQGTAIAYSAATTNQYGAVQLTFYMDLASTVKAGSYSFTLSLDWMTSQSSGLTQTAVVTPPPVAPLSSSFQVEGTTWGTTSSAAAPIPGTQDEPLVVSIQYLGTASVVSIEGLLTLPSGVTNLNGGSTATAYAATATANQVITLTFYLDIGAVQPGSYSFPLELSWLTSVSTSVSQSATVSPPPVAASTSSSFSLSLSQVNSTIITGALTPAGFKLTNGGTSGIYSPTFTLDAVSPVILSSEGTTTPTTEILPGSSTTFTAELTAGPSATAGVYSGTLSVAFADSAGTSHTETFPVSFTVEGTVLFVLQDTTITQSTTGFTVTGSILNEGTVAADYASVSAVIETSSATSVYIGDIDTDTPTTFSITIPFTAPTSISTGTASTSVTFTAAGSFTRAGNLTRAFNFTGGFPGAGNRTIGPGFNGTSIIGGTGSAGATIMLTLSYKNTFGTNESQAFPLSTTIKTASQLGGGGSSSITSNTSSSDSGIQDLAYGVVVAIMIVLVAGAVMVRRYRKQRLPPGAPGEQSVI